MASIRRGDTTTSKLLRPQAEAAKLGVAAASGLATITLNRPQALHALNTHMCANMIQALLSWRDDDSVKAILIDHAPGTRGFCAGVVRAVDIVEQVVPQAPACPASFDLGNALAVAAIEHGWEPGGFLMAVLEDRLTESFCRADGWNQQRMLGWATVMYNDVPRDARGSKEHVGRWIAHRGLRGLMTEKTDG